MPVKKIDYSKTIIYRIVCKDTNITECYVGQTTNFIHRKRQHKSSCNTNNTFYLYEFIRDNMGWDNWDMIEIEKYNAIDSNDAKKRERYWIEYYNSKLNVTTPLRTQQEYYENNKQYFKEKNKEYNEKNKEQIAEYRKEYYENNKEQLLEKNKKYMEENKQYFKDYYKEYRIENKELISKKSKQYYENNKERVLDYQKQYCENNKELIREKIKEKITCVCGCIITKKKLPRHQKTQKHLNAINNI